MFCPWFSLFSFVGRGKKVTAILRHSSSRGLCTPEVKIASVPVPAFTGNKWRQATCRYEKTNRHPIEQNPLNLLENGASSKPKANTRPERGGSI